MTRYFLTGAGTDIGKTFVACALIHQLKSESRAVEAFKPVVSGFDPAAVVESDPGRLLKSLGRPITPATLDAISPWRFRAPLAPPLAARLEHRALHLDEVAGWCRSVMNNDAVTLVEGAGGVMSPLTDRHTNLDLIRALDLPVILVAGSYLGAMSHTLTAASVLLDAGVALKGIVISESKESASLEATLAMLADFLPTVRHVGLPRCERYDDPYVPSLLRLL